MASSKPKTTMNKLNRERKVRERRLDKQARKVARQNAPADTQVPGDHLEYWVDAPDVTPTSSEKTDEAPDAAKDESEPANEDPAAPIRS